MQKNFVFLENKITGVLRNLYDKEIKKLEKRFSGSDNKMLRNLTYCDLADEAGLSVHTINNLFNQKYMEKHACDPLVALKISFCFSESKESCYALFSKFGFSKDNYYAKFIDVVYDELIKRNQIQSFYLKSENGLICEQVNKILEDYDYELYNYEL